LAGLHALVDDYGEKAVAAWLRRTPFVVNAMSEVGHHVGACCGNIPM
jgi:hypothetical protein